MHYGNTNKSSLHHLRKTKSDIVLKGNIITLLWQGLPRAVIFSCITKLIGACI